MLPCTNSPNGIKPNVKYLARRTFFGSQQCEESNFHCLFVLVVERVILLDLCAVVLLVSFVGCSLIET
ncbi:hypothetical protein T09_7825 [Trichinella sp. T9]|nr:hypothetical protein T09_7825 [Trichinella sp. T9]